jgi:hypothetical protein
VSMADEASAAEVARLLESGEIFHEKQSLMLCGVHALNNLFCAGYCASLAGQPPTATASPTAREPAKFAAAGAYQVTTTQVLVPVLALWRPQRPHFRCLTRVGSMPLPSRSSGRRCVMLGTACFPCAE